MAVISWSRHFDDNFVGKKRQPGRANSPHVFEAVIDLMTIYNLHSTGGCVRSTERLRLAGPGGLMLGVSWRERESECVFGV